MNRRHYKRPESVLVLVHRVDGQILLLRRRQPAGYWQSVTGSLAWQENSPEQAARRELAEELGLVDTSGLRDWQYCFRFSILPAWRHRYAGDVTHNVEHLFSLQLATDCDLCLNPTEHDQFCWLTPEAARARADSWTNRAAIDLLLRHG